MSQLQQEVASSEFPGDQGKTKKEVLSFFFLSNILNVLMSTALMLTNHIFCVFVNSKVLLKKKTRLSPKMV